MLRGLSKGHCKERKSGLGSAAGSDKTVSPHPSGITLAFLPFFLTFRPLSSVPQLRCSSSSRESYSSPGFSFLTLVSRTVKRASTLTFNLFDPVSYLVYTSSPSDLRRPRPSKQHPSGKGVALRLISPRVTNGCPSWSITTVPAR
jgi:hypothetical protein